MLLTLIFLQLSAHLLADFVFQPQQWSDSKRLKAFTRHHVFHILVVFVLSWLFSLDINFWPAALAVTIIHFAADIMKSKLQIGNRKNNKPGSYFFTDQFIHLVTLAAVAVVYDYFGRISFLLDMNLKTASIIAAFILCAKPANIIIKNIFEVFSVSFPEEKSTENPTSKPLEKSLPNAGKVIGVAERFLALALILAGQYSAVGLIIAAKSILRFNDTRKNEYILVGTLLSFGIAVLSGVLIKTLILGK